MPGNYWRLWNKRGKFGDGSTTETQRPQRQLLMPARCRAGIRSAHISVFSVPLWCSGLFGFSGVIENTLGQVVSHRGFVTSGFRKRVLQRLVFAVKNRLADVGLDAGI